MAMRPGVSSSVRVVPPTSGSRGLTRREFLGRGYATEAAAASRDYARDVLGLDRIRISPEMPCPRGRNWVSDILLDALLNSRRHSAVPISDAVWTGPGVLRASTSLAGKDPPGQG